MLDREATLPLTPIEHQHEDQTVHHFRIAEFPVTIVFRPSEFNGMHLLPSFEPFRTQQHPAGAPVFLTLVVDDSLRPVRRTDKERIGDFDTGNGHTIVDHITDGGYQYIIKDVDGDECCLLQTNSDFSHCQCALKGNYNMRKFGLNNALMLAFAFKGSYCQTLLIHASLVRHQGKGYAFVAKSGTGKSTHVNLWLSNIPECDLMNDDNPIVRVIDGQAFIYGSPWSGKTPCYRNVKAPLGAITRIDRAKQNSIDRLNSIQAFASLLPTCSSMKWDKTTYNFNCLTLSQLIATTPVFTLHCLPDRAAAELCHNTIAQ